MQDIIEQWKLKWKRGGRVDKAFLVIGVLLAAPPFLKEQITKLFPDGGAKLATNAWLDKYLLWVCLAAVVLLLAYAVWKIWLRTPPTPKEVIIDPGPLKGGSSYGPQDGELFLRLGRQDELGQLWGWVQDANVPFIAIKAESGAGKTSLLRCGLHYLLTQKFDALTPKQSAATPCIYCEMRPSDPVGDLLAAIRAEWKSIAGDATPPPATLPELLERAAALPRRLVLLLDQFEQLREEEPRHTPIFDFLAGLAARRGPCRLTCVVAFREEYASAWMNFSVQRLDAQNLSRPRELILNLFRRDDRPERSADAVLATLAEQAKLDLEDARKPLLAALTDLRGRVSPFDLSVSLLCLSQLGRSRLEARDIPPGGLQGLFAQYLRGLLQHLKEDERAVVFSAIYFDLLEHANDGAGDGPRRVAEGRTLSELTRSRSIEPRRLEYALNTLAQREAGLLERLPGVDGEPRYRLLHERFVQALRTLSGVLLADADKARAKLRHAYQAYSPANPWSHLLTGADLRLVHHHWADLPRGEDAPVVEKFYQRSLRRRTVSRVLAAGVMAALLGLPFGIAEYRHAIERKSLEKELRKNLSKWLPSDLCDVQDQITKLVIENTEMDDARWITAPLTHLELRCPQLQWPQMFPQTLTNLSLVGCNVTNAAVCSGLPALSSLNLSGNRMTTLAGLEKLPALTSLVLSGNGLTTLAGLEKLPTLTSLVLREKGLTTLAGLEKLPALTSLVLSGSNLTILAGLEKLPTLTSLNLNGKGLTTLVDLEKLPALTSLVLNECSLTTLAGLEKLSALTNLVLRGDFPEVTIDNLAGLEILPAIPYRILSGDFSRNGLNTLAGLEKLTTLTSLDLSGNGLTSLAGLEKMNALTSLGLSRNRLTTLAGLEKMNALTLLDLRGNGLTNLAGLEKLTALTSLGLSDYGMPTLAELEKLPALTSLDLSLNGLTTLAGLEKLPALTSLNLNGSGLTTLAGLKELTALTNLLFKGGFRQNRVSTLAGLEELAALNSLDLSRNVLPTLSGLEKLTALTKLVLTENGLTTLAGLEKMTTLTSLDLRGNGLITLAGLEKLTELNYLAVPQVDLGPLEILANHPKLMMLDMSGRYFAYGPVTATNCLMGEIRFGNYRGKLKPLPTRIRSLVFYDK